MSRAHTCAFGFLRLPFHSLVRSFLDHMALPDTLVFSICEGEVNEKYVEALRTLMDKFQYATSVDEPIMWHVKDRVTRASIRGSEGIGAQEEKKGMGKQSGAHQEEEGGNESERVSLGVAPGMTRAAKEVIPELNRLRLKAVQRVRDYLIKGISTLRGNTTNVQMLQRNVLLKVRTRRYRR